MRTLPAEAPVPVALAPFMVTVSSAPNATAWTVHRAARAIDDFMGDSWGPPRHEPCRATCGRLLDDQLAVADDLRELRRLARDARGHLRRRAAERLAARVLHLLH